MGPEATTRLSDWIAELLGEGVRVTALKPLKGGGIQENWTVEAEVSGAPRAFVLRKDAPATIEASHSRRNEFALIRAAHAADVTVPEPIGFCDDPAVAGGPFALMAKVGGLGLGPKVVKEIADAHRRPLTERLAREMARIHRITSATAAGDIAFLGAPPADFARAEIALMRRWLDALAAPRPGSNGRCAGANCTSRSPARPC